MRRLWIAGLVALDLIACGLVYDYDDLRGPPASVSASSVSSSSGSGGSAGSGGEGPGGECTSASSSGAGGCGSPNLDEDPENCGACGHSCLGGYCNLGRCQPTQLDLGTNGSAREVRVFGGYVYYLSDSCFGRIAREGGTGSCLLMTPPVEDPFSRFAIDDAGAYITKLSGEVVTLRNGEDVPASLLLPGALNVPYEIAVDDANAYVNSQNDLVRVGKDNDSTDAGPVSLVAPGFYVGHAIMLDGDEVFYTTANYDAGTVGRVPKDGGLSITMTQGIQCEQAAQWGDQIYTTDGLEIVRIAKTAIENEPVPVSTSPHHVFRMTVDCENVYWTAYDSATQAGGIYKAPRGGGEAVELAGSTEHPRPTFWVAPRGIAVDEKAIYWANGALWVLAR